MNRAVFKFFAEWILMDAHERWNLILNVQGSQIATSECLILSTHALLFRQKRDYRDWA